MTAFSRHHFIPVGYLKGFANRNNKFYRLKLNPIKHEQEILERPVKKVGFQTDLYTITEPALFDFFKIENKDSKFIEKNCFLEVENNISQVIEKIKSGGNINENQRKIICLFMLTSLIRHPSEIDRIKTKINNNDLKEFTNESLITFLKTHLESKVPSSILIKKLNSLREKLNLDYLAKLLFHLQILDITLNPNSEIANKWLQTNMHRKFNIYQNKNSVPFITSNYPVFANKSKSGLPSYSMPLTKGAILEIDNSTNYSIKGEIIPVRLINDNLAHTFNGFILNNSKGEVFSGDKKILNHYKNQAFQNKNKAYYNKLLSE